MPIKAKKITKPKYYYKSQTITLFRLKKKNNNRLNKKCNMKWNKKNHKSNYIKANKMKKEKNLIKPKKKQKLTKRITQTQRSLITSSNFNNLILFNQPKSNNATYNNNKPIK